MGLAALFVFFGIIIGVAGETIKIGVAVLALTTWAVAVFAVRPEIIFILFLVVVPLPDFIPLPGVTVSMLVGALMLFFIGIKEIALRKNLKVRMSDAGVFLFLYLLLSGLMIFRTISLAPDVTAVVVKLWIMFAMGASMFFIGQYFIKNKRDLSKVIAAIIIGTLLVAFANLALIGGLMLQFHEFNLYKIRQLIYDPKLGITALFASWGNTNVIGTYLAYVECFVLGFAYIYRKFALKAFFISVILLGAILFLASRTAIVAVMVTVMIIAVLHMRKPKTLHWVNTMHVIFLLAVLLVCLFVLIPSGFNIMKATLSNGKLDYSSSFRLQMWKDIISFIPNAPLGLGFMSFNSRNSWVMNQGVRALFIHGQNSHNTYLDILLDTGLPGLFVWLMFCVLVIKKNVQACLVTRGDAFLRGVSFGSLCAFIAALIAFTTGMQHRMITFMAHFWLIAGLPFAVEYIVRSKKSAPEKSQME